MAAGGAIYNYQFLNVPYVRGIYTLFAYATDAATINSDTYSNRVFSRFVGGGDSYYLHRKSMGQRYYWPSPTCPTQPVYWDNFDIRTHPEVTAFQDQHHTSVVLEPFMGGRPEWQSKTGIFRAHIEVPAKISASGDYPGWYNLDGHIRLSVGDKDTLTHEFGHHVQRVVNSHRPCYGESTQCTASVEGFARAFEGAPYGTNPYELGSPGGGPTNTFSVAGGDGDLIDPANEVVDPISGRFDLLYDIIRLDEPECVQLVPERWRARGFPSPDDVDAIYAVQGISPSSTCP